MEEIHGRSDRDLVEAVLARRPKAFERLIHQYQGLCWHIVQRMVRDPEDARDLCQETFLRVYRYLHQYRHDSTLKSWIGRVAYTTALRHLERRRLPLNARAGDEDDASAVLEVSDGRDIEAEYLDEEATRLLRAAIDSLPPLQRTLLALYHIEELPIPEIARITGIAAGTIKSHLFRTRRRLLALLETHAGATT
jgi:RNA polymerase sigma-70 factor, ECF subfamily